MKKSKIMDANELPEHIMEEIYRLSRQMKEALDTVCIEKPVQFVLPALNILHCSFVAYGIREIKRMGATPEEVQDFKDRSFEVFRAQIELWEE